MHILVTQIFYEWSFREVKKLLKARRKCKNAKEHSELCDLGFSHLQRRL